MTFIYSDGGRAEAGLIGTTGDCVVRALSIATGMPYTVVRDHLDSERFYPTDSGHEHAYQRCLANWGWTWTPSKSVPRKGRVIALLKSEEGKTHLTAVIDGAARDLWDPIRDGRHAILGYYARGAP